MERLVTLFGGGGLIGRYAAQALYRTGARVRIAQRDPGQAYFLRPLGGLGQTQFVKADITKPDDVARAVEGSHMVVNLVGILKGEFRRVHVVGARNIAEAAALAGSESLVQLSAIGADPDSPSAYGRSKGEGEAAVRAAFPNATILRPSTVFGQEDRFVNRFATMARFLPVVPVIRPQVRLQPVWAADVGAAISAAAIDYRSHGGKTYELGGPQVMTMHELNEIICRETGRYRPLLDIPDPLGALIARIGFLPGAPITWDQWLMLRHDSVATENGFKYFGISPHPLAVVADGWLTPYRRHGRFFSRSPY